ncbi:hypothetical protein B0I35DRAFT_472285 [Stachybotrys elegans]|uniref:Non-ribosomal peptide synthetase n=1 Tax=Stachybotrys elegans TaxID=80388 RepID=A0A8K0SGI3_9HYPO|nr:hypothetical protein B0I35DRAFT_472285 [Stachybotrys elegans]
MSFTYTPSDGTTPGTRSEDFDDAEKGLFDASDKILASPPKAHVAHIENKLLSNAEALPSPVSPIHEGITPSVTTPVLQLSGAPANRPPSPGASGSKSEKPAKKKASRWVRFRLWYNPYRQFFTVATSLNLTGIIMAGIGRFPYAQNHLGAMVLGNLLFAILMRNELLLRFLYTVAIYGLRSWAPLRLKLAATSALQHVGGIHSGCALSGCCWLVYNIVDIIRHRAVQHDSVIATGIITSCFVIISVLSAFPWVRNNYHNTFERHHRFVGWLGLAATWAFVILGNSYDIRTGVWRADANTLMSTQELWFAVFMTIFVLIPWVTLRRVPVEVEIPSPKVAVLRFNRGMQQGLLGRISRTSVMEYHAFGIISEGRKSPYHYMVCGVQGDFTKGLVTNPPKMVWTRELKFAGVGHASAMFKRGIRVCTGTGIGAALSTCIQSKNWFLIWIGSDQEKTFGPTISRLIHDNIEPERMILWDTKKRGGRPDSMQLLRDTYENFGAEVIFITSNMAGNDEMMQGCREAGINAFGTLWDF